ncbi:MAG TPA: hypothetical protein DDY31_03845 [Lachnospiraceae bacterium]|nr:hypothetical protein [Lachnospiraceae bacterium]
MRTVPIRPTLKIFPSDWQNGVIMKSIPKFLLLAAILSSLTILPEKESSAKDTFLPEFTSFETASADNFTLRKKSSFNEKASLAKYEKNILQEDTCTLKVLNFDEDCDISFKSSDTDVLTVKQLSENSCSYTGVGYGTAKIKVKLTKTTFLIFKEQKTLTAKVKVTPRAVSVVFRQNSREIEAGTKMSLSYTIRPSISEEVPVFESQNPKIASISKNGKVNAKKTGKTFITAMISNGQKAKCKIIVVEAAEEE